ncbi:MAG: peptidase S8 [Bacteroidetes bacterium]|nr:MAG: peptidase S8 [Bacteroidota bacterium]
MNQETQSWPNRPIKAFYLTLLAIFLLLQTSSAQKPFQLVRLKTGNISPELNLLNPKNTPASLARTRYKDKYYAIIQFRNRPSSAEKTELASQGVRLFDYLPGQAFLAEVADSNAFSLLSNRINLAIYELPSSLKISSKLSGGNEGLPIAVSFFGSIDKQTVKKDLADAGASILETKIQPAHVIFIHASQIVLLKIATIPYVSNISPQSLIDVPLNYNNRAIHAIDALSASTGRNLDGKSVTLGIGDNGDPSTHIDLSRHLIQRNALTIGSHSTHTSGTMAGGGIINPKYKGMAPKATIVSQYFSDIIVNSPVYINDYNMVITSNSYYTGADLCPGDGEYDAVSNYVDSQMNALPKLLHVIAAGNDGTLTCGLYPSSFATIKSGLQCGKNVLTVGNLNNLTYVNATTSSKGPTMDGRLKPEIVAGGVTIRSTLPYDNYGNMSGTSMSCPTTAGAVALLYQRYRQLHGGTDPPASLIKVLTCNSADDIGNQGPDFTYGFGMLNARTAVESMENNQYFQSAISQDQILTHTINGLPGGSYQLKIMLYWPDAAAAPFAASSLVNNLDLTVNSPDGIVHHPLILDSSPTSINNIAVEGVDSINNIEQVVINNPPPGNFTIQVKGTNIPSGPQNYVVAYQIINPSVTVEYPFGNETWVPGENETIRWSAYGGGNNNFTIEYSIDGGATWNTINNNVPFSNRSYSWTVPATATNAALIRVTRNGTAYADASDYPFTILGQPTLSAWRVCRGYTQLIWNTIPSATQYEIMMLKSDSMQTFATTTDTSYLVAGLNPDTTYYFSVRAVNNGNPGRRALASTVQPSLGPCSLPAFNYDFTIDGLNSPQTGRLNTSTQLGVASPNVRIRNLGTLRSVSPYNVSYQVNNGPVITETSNTPIGLGSVSNFSFSNAGSFDFSAAGSYSIKVWVDYPGDPQLLNDTFQTTIKQLGNNPIVLNPTFLEGFESAAAASYTTPTFGLDSLDRFDFSSSSTNGRARTFVNTGFARSGNRCGILDQIQNTGTMSADSLVGTFNLSGYGSADQVWLDFYYRNQGIDFSAPGNRIWIRGNDQAAWILADTLSINPDDFGLYKPFKSIDVTGILSNASPAQVVSSSFQVKFGEQGFTSVTSVIPDGDLDDGYCFDDITLTKSSNDAGILSLVQPSLSSSCTLTNAETITTTVKNYSSIELDNIPITYALDGDTVTETIAALLPYQTIAYSFSQKADMSAWKDYRLSIWVSYPADNYRKNDSLSNIDIQTTPLISQFPYLEGFENNDGHWYTRGIHDDWQWGTPTKTIINKAANGTKAWVTKLTGNYSGNELSYLYSPCFDLSSLTKPVFSFSHIFQMEDNCDCDYHWVEYSTDDSVWIKLGNTTGGTNWYDNAARNAWQLSNMIWHVSSFDIPVNPSRIRFRIVMKSDPATDYEGVGIDDVHVFEKTPVYDSTSGLNISLPVSGNNWTDFDVDGRRIASINPNGQNLGVTKVKVFMNNGAVRDTINQYYLERNIVIQPATPANAPVSVRFYFLDKEVNDLINASGCAQCSGITDAYEAGVTQYSSQNLQEEDSILGDNKNGLYGFFKPRQDVICIPYDNGYYVEYKVNGFSEFWINGGGIGKNEPVAGVLKSFTATKINDQGFLQWVTWQEKNVSGFVIQKSSDSLQFSDFGNVTAKGSSDTLTNYQFTDTSSAGSKIFYRLKILLSNGQFIYSPVRSIDFGTNYSLVKIFPNPVKGILHINTTANCRQILIFDVSGRLVRNLQTVGFQNTLNVSALASGVYFVRVSTDAGDSVQKLVVE